MSNEYAMNIIIARVYVVAYLTVGECVYIQ